MKLSLSALALLFSFHLFANTSETLLQQLSSVNNEWSKQPEHQQVLQTAGAFHHTNFNQWIATHLMLVEKTLRARDVSELTTSQKQNRLNLLNELNGYWKAGVFPINDYLFYKNPVFIDRNETHCAVGYLMMQSGYDALAEKIDANEKFAYVHEIKTAGVTEWATEQGFTVDELAWIQPGYPPSTPCYDLDGGLNGTVNVITADTTSQVIYVGGSFTQSTMGTTCNNVAAWISGFAGWDWVPVGKGVNGPVCAMLLHNNKLYVGGEFTTAGSVAAKNVAVYDIAQGQWQAIASLDSSVRALAFYNNELYAGGNFTGFVSKWNGTAWIDVAQGFLYGEGVRTFEVWNNELVIGGNFELATGALRRHVATYDGTYMGNLGFGTLTPVNDFAFFDGKLFAACYSTSICALATFDGNDWNVHLKDMSNSLNYFSGKSISCLAATDSMLYAGGDFFVGTNSIMGKGLMGYIPEIVFGGTVIYDVYGPPVLLDSTVNSIALSGNNLFFGGNFLRANNGWPGEKTLNHIANIGSNMSDYTSIPSTNSETLLSVFPNPATEQIRVQASGNGTLEQVEIFDATGRRVFAERINEPFKTISIATLSSGIYTVKATVNGVAGVSKLVKQ